MRRPAGSGGAHAGPRSSPLPANVQEALKELARFLDSDALLRALDAGTAGLPPGAAITAASWPGLALALVKHVEAELARSAAGKKGPEPALSRTFRLMMARAEEGERRSGHARMMLRAAARLFKHATGVRRARPRRAGATACAAAARRTAAPRHRPQPTACAAAPPRPPARRCSRRWG